MNEDPENIRAFMAIICSLSSSYELFSIQQSGNIWIIEEPGGQELEIVAYKVARIFPPEQADCFAEIEPYHTRNIELALTIIDRYEKLLGLTGHICEQSIGELFRPSSSSPTT